MQLRRARTALSGIRWWAVFALLAAVVAVALAFTGRHLPQVIAVAAFAVTLAILATREEST
jgi:hypothetical protein